MSNMALEDLMNALAHWGTVSVVRKRFPVAASPGLKGRSVQWEVTVRIPGYKNEHGQPYFSHEGQDILDAVERCYSDAENYLYSDLGRAERANAVAEHQRHNEAARRLNPGNISTYLPRERRPIEPDVTGPDAPSIECETY